MRLSIDAAMNLKLYKGYLAPWHWGRNNTALVEVQQHSGVAAVRHEGQPAGRRRAVGRDPLPANKSQNLNPDH